MPSAAASVRPQATTQRLRPLLAIIRTIAYVAQAKPQAKGMSFELMKACP
jgi:hypothetical protein